MKPIKIIVIFSTLLLTQVACSIPDPKENQSLLDYCQNYVEAAVEEKLGDDLKVTSTVSFLKLDHFTVLISNIFQPSDSDFYTSYRCSFVAGSNEGDVVLLLVENEDFANHTKWPRILYTEIGETTIEGKKYYIVPKYLKINGTQV